MQVTSNANAALFVLLHPCLSSLPGYQGPVPPQIRQYICILKLSKLFLFLLLSHEQVAYD